MTGCFDHYWLRVFIELESHSTFTRHIANSLARNFTCYNIGVLIQLILHSQPYKCDMRRFGDLVVY